MYEVSSVVFGGLTLLQRGDQKRAEQNRGDETGPTQVDTERASERELPPSARAFSVVTAGRGQVKPYLG
jgi:hypothetical protein